MVFQISRKRILLHTVALLLLIVSLLVIPTGIAFSGKVYPNLDVWLVFLVVSAGFTGAFILFELIPQTVSINLGETGFTVKKWGSRSTTHPYSAITSYNKRLQVDRSSTYTELTMYMPTNWFMLRSNAFDEYAYLKTELTHYGQPVPYRNVLTRTERARFRWFLGGLSLLIIVSIVFGFAAHNPVSKNPAPLRSFSTLVDEVWVSKSKGNFKGISFRLHHWPELWFFASRRDFDQDIRFLR